MNNHTQFNLNNYQNDLKDINKPEMDFVSSPNVVRLDKSLVVKGFFSVNDTDSIFRHGQIIARKAISGNYSIATLDFVVGITSLATAPIIGLPRPKLVGNGKTYIIKDEVGGAGTTTITIRSTGEENIDGSATSTLTTNYQSKSFYSDGSNWFTY